MYFKKLEILGFKSFADKTVLHFEHGITAIVGPNGCGKSNIFDAIRLVLGEQSVKALRGSEMQDVIFNGADQKEPLSYAEVSFTLSNENKILPIEYDEVEVTRKIYRSGESEYFINRTQVRLKDINDLLAGTGIGAEAYSLVEQGKIDLILSSKPEERRIVFDEASGITRYKSQKKEALRKLEDTENNLLRLNDIITEVKRQIGSLERQANKARRYQEVFNELKDKEINLSVFLLNSFKKESEDIANQINKISNDLSGLLIQQDEANSQVISHRTELKTVEDEILNIKNKYQSLENLISVSQQHLDINSERTREIAERLKLIDSQKPQIEYRKSQEESRLNILKTEEAQIEDFVAGKQRLMDEKFNEQKLIEDSLSEARDKIQSAKAKIMEFALRHAEINNALQALNSNIHTALARKKRLELEKIKSHQEKELTKSKFDVLDNECNQVNEKLNSAKNRSLELSKKAEDDQSLIVFLKEKIKELEKEISILKTQREFLNELKLKYEQIPHVFNAVVFLDELPQGKISGILAKVDGVCDISEEEKSKYPGYNFKLTSQVKPIPMDTKDIEDKISLLEKELAAKTEELNQKEREVALISEELEKNNQLCHQYEIEFSNKNTLREQARAELSKVEEEEQLVIIEEEDTEKALEELNLKEASLKQEFENINLETSDNTKVIEASQRFIEEKSKILQENEVLIAEYKTELQGVSVRVQSLKGSIKIVEDALLQEDQTLKNLEDERLVLNKRTQELEESSKQLLIDIEDSKAKMDELNMSLTQMNTKEYFLVEKIKALEESCLKIQKDSEHLKGVIHKDELDLQQIKFKRESLIERVNSTYKTDVGLLAENKAAENQPVEINVDVLSGEITALKDKLSSYGNVSLVAIDEYDELKKRYDFMMQQEQDLVQSKEALREAITKINRTTRKMFLETFAKIQEEFKNYFKLLFGGGSAELFLLDQENVLESGIEIICRPPGKKLQNVLLLSGGEKSLSATALLFSLFKVKPSPFCILDEIDAALDESNVGRFSAIVKEFSNTSQFIVITHNKKTIANANVMYGITMQNSGVSKIVSVKFHEHNKESTGVVEAVAV